MKVWRIVRSCSSEARGDPVLPAGRQPRAHGRTGALQRAVHRRDRHLQNPGHLLRRPVEHVAQDQDGSLPGGQVLEGREEGELDGLARDRRRLGLGF